MEGAVSLKTTKKSLSVPFLFRSTLDGRLGQQEQNDGGKKIRVDSAWLVDFFFSSFFFGRVLFYFIF